MAPQSVIDSHVHLWPKETSNESGHAWMTPPDMPLAKPHLSKDYLKASSQGAGVNGGSITVEAVVFVETDVRYETPTGDVSSWARGPLDEVGFLRDCVEGQYDPRDSDLLQSLVPWAPMDQSTPVLEEYLALAEQRAGPETWRRVKGFRFLLQSIKDEENFRDLVLGHNFISNLKLLGKRGFSFDIGLDQHRAGSFQLEIFIQAMRMAHDDVSSQQQVVFIANHLCKPLYGEQSSVAFKEWKDAITAMSKVSKTYMKLSGQFSELDDHHLSAADDAANLIKLWVKHILQTFGPERVMFGSDWPVCNVSGPSKEHSWMDWSRVVRTLVDDDITLTTRDKDRIWRDTAIEAYRLRPAQR